ncbi:hypothetical protein BDZ89DRAFT_961256, partial [Hymenopellis radicata]
YTQWCKESGFVSMLPEDTKARRTASTVQLEQGSLDGHLVKQAAVVKKPVIPYTVENYELASLRWLICTDQSLRAFEEPTYLAMMELAKQAPRDKPLPIPSRKMTRKQILLLANDHLAELKKLFNVSCTAYL